VRRIERLDAFFSQPLFFDRFDEINRPIIDRKINALCHNREIIDLYPVRRLPAINVQLNVQLNAQLNAQFKSLTRHNRVILTYHRAATGRLPVTESFVLPPDSGAAP
jgi:hypothetical protein